MTRRGAACIVHALRRWNVAGDARLLSGAAQTPTPFVAAWGNGDFGRLGVDAACRNQLQPQRMRGLPAGASPTAVRAGGAHTLVLLQTGDGSSEVWSCGLNDWGQLGHSASEEHAALPRRVLGLPPDVCDVAAGAFHSLAVTRSGELWAWGRNKEQQCGLGAAAAARVDAPARVALDAAVAAIAAGMRHSLAVAHDGALYSWGARALLGLGEQPWQAFASRGEHTPRLVRALRGVRVLTAAAGGQHSAVADADGRVFTFGDGHFNQLGTGDDRAAAEPVLVADVHAVAHVACGGLHTLCATHGGDVYSWGANEHGCLGLGDVGGPQLRTPSRVPDVALARGVSAGWKHSAGVSAGGALYTFGWGGTAGEGEHSSGGQLGLDSECDFWAPVRVTLPDGTRALQVDCGWNHSAGLFVSDAA